MLLSTETDTSGSILVKDEEFTGLADCDQATGVEIDGLTVK